MKTFFTNNRELKIVAIFLAIFLWALIIRQQKEDRELNINVSIDKPSYLMIANDFDKKIMIKIRGPRRIIKGISEEKIFAQINLKRTRAGYISYQITPDKINLPQGVEILSIKPSNLFLYLDYIETKIVPVKANFIGTLSTGYRITSVDIEPRVMTIEGARRDIQSVSEIYLDAINIDNIEDDFEQKLEAILPAPNIWFKSANSFTLKAKVRQLHRSFLNKSR